MLWKSFAAEAVTGGGCEVPVHLDTIRHQSGPGSAISSSRDRVLNGESAFSTPFDTCFTGG
jgi:hypothetical protein